MEKKRYFHLVGTGPKPGKEEEYNAWYNEHVTMLFEIEELRKVTRTRMYKPFGQNGEESPRYVTIYEFEHEDDFDKFCSSSIMDAAKEHYETQGDAVSEIYWAGAYESVILLDKD